MTKLKECNCTLPIDNNASNDAMMIIDKYTNGKLSVGEYAHELVTETYINLISQIQSGQKLCVNGQMLDFKVDIPHPISNTGKFINGYILGKFTVNYQQYANTVTCDYNENEQIIITKINTIYDKSISNNSIENIIYAGSFKDITQDGISILELCLKFSALNYDMFLDVNLLKTFSEAISETNNSIDELKMLNVKKL